MAKQTAARSGPTEVIKTKAASPVAVTIRLDREASVRFADIISQLKKAGLVDVQAHERLMIVSGSASYLDLEALRSVPGVLSVREDTSYRAL